MKPRTLTSLSQLLGTSFQLLLMETRHTFHTEIQNLLESCKSLLVEMLVLPSLSAALLQASMRPRLNQPLNLANGNNTTVIVWF